MLHQVMIIANSGVCLFCHEFTEVKVNSQLFSGFAIALNGFAKELIEHDQNIESVKMTEIQLLIAPFKIFFLVLVVNNYDEPRNYDSIIVNLQNLFLEMYGHIKENNLHEIEQYEEFHKVIERLCQFHIPIAIIGKQSKIKSDFWDCVSSKSESGPDRTISDSEIAQDNWNVMEIKFPLFNHIFLSLWNINSELGFESLAQSVENKPICVLIFEPQFDQLLDIIPMIASLKKYKKNALILGLALPSTNSILPENCEIILKIPVFSVDLQTPDAKSKIFQFLFTTVMGK